MGAGSDKDYASAFSGFLIDLVNQQEIAAYVAFAVTRRFSFELMVEPFCAKGWFVGNQEEYDVLEAISCNVTP